MKFEYTWRWYGPDDPITLSEIKQTEATGIVNALHHLPPGEVWEKKEIEKRKKVIEDAGLRWSVVESVPVHKSIKKRTGDFEKHIKNYKKTIQNLGESGISTLCYNFMPVLDWTRTDLNYKLPNGSFALRFDPIVFAAFDLFILRRKQAQQNYSADHIVRARKYAEAMTDEDKRKLTDTIIAGLPGGHPGYSLAEFQSILDEYEEINEEQLQGNLSLFLQEVIPTAEKYNVNLCIHPDDPPFPILGLPRVVSTTDDVERIFSAVDSPNNGLTFCTGSFGVREDDDLPEMISRFAERIHFLHFRSVQRNQDGSFHEADHLEGNADLARVMKSIIQSDKLDADHTIPVRPDHGHLMLDDITKEKTNPGYSLIGRMKGLNEIRGLEQGIRVALNDD